MLLHGSRRKLRPTRKGVGIVMKKEGKKSEAERQS